MLHFDGRAAGRLRRCAVGHLLTYSRATGAGNSRCSTAASNCAAPTIGLGRRPNPPRRNVLAHHLFQPPPAGVSSQAARCANQAAQSIERIPMSQVTISHKSPLVAAAVITAAGFLTVPAPAQAV